MQMMNAGMTNCNAAGGSSNSSSNDVDNSATNRSHSAAGSSNPNGLSSLANPLNLSVVSNSGRVQLATKAANLTISSGANFELERSVGFRQLFFSPVKVDTWRKNEPIPAETIRPEGGC